MAVSPIVHRRALHRIPELDFDLPKTTAYIRGVLEPLGFELTSPSRGALCAYLDCKKPYATAFRADMDALPVNEGNAVDYASEHPGRMHACGHDGHMAMALSLAERVCAAKEAAPANLLLVFQPAEETTGGAKAICESGVFDRYNVKSIYGAHLWPQLPAGEVFSKAGAVMARSSEVKINIHGRSVHIARAAQGADATLTAARLLLSCGEMERTELPESEARVLSFGVLKSGTACNVLSDYARLEGSMRVFSDMTYEYIKRRIGELAKGICEETGCTADVDINEGYPPLINSPEYYTALCKKLGDAAPASLPAPFMQTEDFSFYLKSLPGAFFFIGTGRDAALHSENFEIDETALERGVEFFYNVFMLGALL